MKTSAAPAMAPVCDAAARWPYFVRPPRNTTTGLRGVVRRMTSTNRRPSSTLRDRPGRRRSGPRLAARRGRRARSCSPRCRPSRTCPMPMPRRSAVVMSCTPMLPDWETMLRRPACGRNSVKPTAWSRLCVAIRPMQLGPDERDGPRSAPCGPVPPRRRLPPLPPPRSPRPRRARGDAALATLLDHRVHLSGPKRHQRQVRSFGQLRDAAERGQTADRSARRFHGIDGAGEAAVDEVEKEEPPHLRGVVRGADDRDGARREQRRQIGGRGACGTDAPRSSAGPRITSASAATGVAPSTMSGFTSISVTAG